MPQSDSLAREVGNAGTQCRNCGTYVSPRFARVFGDNDDELHRCLECSTLRDLQRGAGIGLDALEARQ